MWIGNLFTNNKPDKILFCKYKEKEVVSKDSLFLLYNFFRLEIRFVYYRK